MTSNPPNTKLDMPDRRRLVLVTGPSGAGRSTGVKVLEDLGFEVIDNLPLSLLEPLLERAEVDRPVALGLDVRNRDFGVDALISAIDGLTARRGDQAQVLYLDCSEDVLVQRYSETRRRHPLAPADPPLVGISQERELLAPIRARADFLIDTSDLSPHDLKAELAAWFSPEAASGFGISVHSFSYRRGLPRGLDIVLDCRFLANPHWDNDLRPLDGRTDPVQDYVTTDPTFEPFFKGLCDMMALLLPAYREEGKSHLSVGFGCTGGKHRSVAVAEMLSEHLATEGWRVSKRHREIERRQVARPESRANGDRDGEITETDKA